MSSFLSDASKLLVRNIELFQGKRCLLMNNPADQFGRELSATASAVYSYNYHFGYHQQLTSQLPSDHCHFGVELPQDWANFDAIIIYWPKEKSLASYLVQHVLNHCQSDAMVYCIGPNKEGIRSAASIAKSIGIKSNKLDAAKHCSLFGLPVASIDDAISPLSIESQQKTFSVEWQQQHIQLVTVPGVFSANHLDDGTALLLNSLPDDLGEQVLDFGCGCGIVATALAHQQTKRDVYAVDVNAFALYATQQTLAANQLSATVYPVTGVNDITQNQLSAIVTNPPFHQGVKTHYQVTEDLIRLAPQKLNRNGQLVAVANRFLQYPELLAAAFKDNQRLNQTSKFVVYQSRS
ncbi:methyltransferase [Neiella marina]|uniref:Ribosomal RNA small subunit methyltransferase C n=1 Tax=Neiella holothuriorum TaxID=2870530 RepID=A0ABS7EKV8_9GAMM|nr:methyltransferase [Neiella holothuriorum]MBW8192915.1 methyltransferase [Neiella holothuriorum]